MSNIGTKLSIRVKLMLWYGLLTGTLLAVFLPVLYYSQTTSLASNEEAQLRTDMAEVIASVEIEGGKPVWNEEEAHIQNSIAVAVDSSGSVFYTNTNLQALPQTLFVPDQVRVLRISNHNWAVLDQPIENEGQIIAWVRVGISREPYERSVTDLRIMMLISAPLFFLIAMVGGYAIARKAMKPVAQITKTARDIQDGDLSRRICGIENSDEVGELADTFNQMLEHLEVSFNREKRFASDASHELRTPVAVVTAYSESLLEQGDISGENALDAVQEIYGEACRMNRIISQLLTLTRGYEGHYHLELEKVDIQEIAASVCDQMSECAERAGIMLYCETSGSLYITGDQSLLTQLLLNLTENAIKYGISGGYVKLGVQHKGNTALLTIADDGIGIEKEAQPLIFERFYRSDKARDRSGTGLGLSIVKWIVQEHHGEIMLDSTIGWGTTVTVSLPVMLQ